MKQKKFLALVPKVVSVIVAFVLTMGVSKAIALAYMAIMPPPPTPYTPIWWLWDMIGVAIAVLIACPIFPGSAN